MFWRAWAGLMAKHARTDLNRRPPVRKGGLVRFGVRGVCGMASRGGAVGGRAVQDVLARLGWFNGETCPERSVSEQPPVRRGGPGRFGVRAGQSNGETCPDRLE